MNTHRIIAIHQHAPPKPAPGQSCNGCGVCCLAILCPLARLRYLRRHGPCPALRWDASARRYLCGMLADARQSWRERWIRRYIAAGQGCDCDIEFSGSL